MNKKGILSEIMEVFFSDSFTQKVTIGFFGLLGSFALVGSFWNPWQLVIFVFCLIIVVSFFKK